MTVIIQIHYNDVESGSGSYRAGEFKLKGKERKVVAFEFWNWIKREHPFEVELMKVICEGEDITELVKELEKAPLD